MLSLFLFLCLLDSATTQLVQPHHQALTQTANVTCYRRNGQYVMRFELRKNSDTIGIVYLVDPENITVNTKGTFDSIVGDISGDGTALTPFTFEAVFNGPLDSLALITPNIFANITPGGLVGLEVVAKENAQLPTYMHFGNDVVWSAVCNFSVQHAVNTQYFALQWDNTEDATRRSDIAVLEVYKISSPNAPAVFAVVSDRLFLVLRLTSGDIGVRGFSCYVKDSSGSVIPVQVTNDFGCPIATDFIGPFRLVNGVYRTPEFPAFSFNPDLNDIIIFDCLIEFCYSPYLADCDNSCISNPGRRKRQAPEEPVPMQTSLTIRFSDGQYRVPPAVPNTTDNTPEFSQNALFITVITLATLFTITLLVAIAVFIHIRGNDKRSKKSIT